MTHALLALAAALLQSPLPDTVRYTVLLAGRPAGVQTCWVAADGARHFFFEFNDRGRGPRLVEEVSLGADGIDRKSTRLNSSHSQISYAVFCLKKKKWCGCGREARAGSQHDTSIAAY